MEDLNDMMEFLASAGAQVYVFDENGPHRVLPSQDGEEGRQAEKPSNE